MLIYNFACSAFLLSHVCHALQKWSDQLWNSGIAVTRRNTSEIPVKNTGIPVKTPVLDLIKTRILKKLRDQFPWISFIPCSLRRLIWVYAVCIGLSVPIFRFFKVLIHASFVCISDEKRLFKISWFSPEEVSSTISRDVPLSTSRWFLNAGQGKCCFVTVHFFGVF